MKIEHSPVNIDSLANYKNNKSNFFTPISLNQGSETIAFYSLVSAGKIQEESTLADFDTFSILLEGSGLFGFGTKLVTAKSGDCRLIPKNRESFFINTSDDEAVMVGFFLGPQGKEQPKMSYTELTEAIIKTPSSETGLIADKDGILVNTADSSLENMIKSEGWEISDFRLPISKIHGSTSTLFRAQFMPGSVHKKHTHQECDEIYYVISGFGLAGAGKERVEVRSGDFHFISKGTEHWLHNLSNTEPIEVVGIYCKAGSVEETGYVYNGEVTAKDLNERTSRSGAMICLK
mgnify:CR=1 FL=1